MFCLLGLGAHCVCHLNSSVLWWSRAARHASYFQTLSLSARTEYQCVLNQNDIVIICNYSVTELGIKYCVHVYLTRFSLIFLSLRFGLILISPNRKFSDITLAAKVKVESCLRQICLACELTLFSFVMFGQFRFNNTLLSAIIQIVFFSFCHIWINRKYAG